MTELFRRLRDKHIFRTAVLYLGGAWAAMEAIGFFVDNYGWSRQVLDVAVLLLVLGFPAVLVIAWFHGERGRQQVQRAELSLLLTLVVLAGIGTYRITRGGEIPAAADRAVPAVTTAASADLGERSVAVLPFENSTGLDSLDWLGPSMSDMLTTNLARHGSLRVVSPQRLFELLRLAGHEETDRIPRELAMNIAARSGARAMVHGSILGTPASLALDAQLIDLRDGTIIGAQRARGEDVFALADSVAGGLAEQLAGPGPPAARGPLQQHPVALTGDLGRLREFQVGLREAWKSLETDSLEALRRVADMLEEVPGREAETRRALEAIVTRAPEAQAVDRLARIAIVQGDTAAADSLIRQFTVVEKDPGRMLAGRGRLLESAGRYEQARGAYRSALELRPGSPLILDALARTYLLEGNPAGAIRELEAYTASPDLAARVEAHLLIGDAHAWRGDFDAALRSYRRAEELGQKANRPDLRAEGLESALYLEWIMNPSAGASRLNDAIWRLIDLGRAEKARDLVEAALRLYLKDADRLFPVEYHALLYAQGRVAELTGNPGAAAEAYGELMRHWGEVVPRLPLLADAPERLARLRSRS